MNITLVAVSEPLFNAWHQECGDLNCVSIHRGSIIEVKCDAVVSPANSFGFMDGGIDAIYSQHFGWNVQNQLQKLICERHHGELLVGTAEIVDTDNSQIPFLIAAPTMRVPMVLSDSVNPYLAVRAALLLIKNGIFASGILKGERVADAIKSVAFPGMGTGVGRIAPAVCARQVRQAIEEIILEKKEFPLSWADAQIRHQKLFADRIRDLQYGD